MSLTWPASVIVFCYTPICRLQLRPKKPCIITWSFNVTGRSTGHSLSCQKISQLKSMSPSRKPGCMKKPGNSLCHCIACLYQATRICALPMSLRCWHFCIFALYALSMWQPGHVVYASYSCTLPNCQASCTYTSASMQWALTCAGINTYRVCFCAATKCTKFTRRR